MTINDVQNLFTFIGGLGMFLFGIHNMSGGIQKYAGDKMRKLLGFLTNNRFIGILVGALITAVIQSSSATTVMIVGFVNAGLMNLGQAVGVIMGANIGTCITAWIVSLGQVGETLKALSPSLYAPLLVAGGAFLMLFGKKEKQEIIGEILIGFGLLFIGLDFMGDSAKVYKDLPIFKQAFSTLGGNPILGILVGFLVTLIMQSSSAVIGILQTLAASGGLVSVAAAVYISFGADIGSCSTALISSVGTTRNAKRAAMMHLLFNLIGVVVFSVVLFFVFRIIPESGTSTIDSVGISMIHTGFKVACTILLVAFSKGLVKLSDMLVKKEPEETAVVQEDEVTLRHLDERMFKEPAFAIENTIKEVVHMGKLVQENMQLAFDASYEYDQKKIDQVYVTEKVINKMEKAITEYLIKLSNSDLTEDQHTQVNNMFYSVSDIERVGDHVENIAEQAEYKAKNAEVDFSEQGKQELRGILDLVSQAYAFALKAREDSDIVAANKVAKYEDQVDSMEEELREQHIDRLSKQLCNPTNGIVFLDMISNLERISDHALNLAEYVISEN